MAARALGFGIPEPLLPEIVMRERECRVKPAHFSLNNDRDTLILEGEFWILTLQNDSGELFRVVGEQLIYRSRHLPAHFDLSHYESQMWNSELILRTFEISSPKSAEHEL